MRLLNYTLVIVAISIFMLNCTLKVQKVSSSPKYEASNFGVEEVYNSISESDIKTHIRFLSDDLLEGRAPGSRGGELAAKYIATQFELIGLEPGSGDSYFQPFSMVGTELTGDMQIIFTKNGKSIELEYLDEYMKETALQVESVAVDAEILFVGYGVQAPEME